MKKRYFFLVVFWAIFVSWVHGLGVPKFYCVSVETNVENNGNVKLRWDVPRNASNLIDTVGFKEYACYYSTDGVLFNEFQSGIVWDVGNCYFNLLDSHTVSKIWFYVEARSRGGQVYRSDTLATIEFTLSITNTAVAGLQWNPPVIPPLPSYSSRYDVYVKYPWSSDFTPLVGAISYYADTVSVCNNLIQYQIRLSNVSGVSCQNVSRVQSGVFSDKTPPKQPVLDSVSVNPVLQPQKRYTMLGWEASSSPDVYAYIIHVEDPVQLGGAIPLDTIYGRFNTSWVDSSTTASGALLRDPSIEVYNYTIAALDSCMNASTRTEYQATMMPEYTLDFCARQCALSWNPYKRMKNGLERYDIWYSTDGGMSWMLAGSTPSTYTAFTITNLQYNQQYLVVVRAVNSNGNITAAAAPVWFDFNVSDSENFVYINSVSVNDLSRIDINITTSGDTLPFSYLLLYRSEDTLSEHFYLLNTFSHVAGQQKYSYTDPDVSVQEKLYYYKAFLKNTCDMLVAESNIAHNIILRGIGQGDHKDELQWNASGAWENGTDQYFVFRKMQSNIDFEALDQVNPEPLILYYEDDVSDLSMHGSEFSYRVVAKTAPGRFSDGEESRSNDILIKQSPSSYIPTAFSPENEYNPVFLPVSSFVDLNHYTLHIYARTGELVFYTTDPNKGWNGTFREQKAPMGVYVYHLQYQQPDGTVYERSGTVTLVR
ncbi:MAG: gliding motility-associated C-terminal domain-containing protein [Bacteroidales bacterium]|nr:gliding motility-associated C-terminal domain-containing protein [Bacteroidales bacterium]